MSEGKPSTALLKGSLLEQMRAPLASDAGAPGADLAVLIDFSMMDTIFADFLEVTGLPVAIIDLDGKVLASSKWQRLCVEFHRDNPGTRARCLESDTQLSREMQAGQQVAIYGCLNGLTDCAAPIVVDGQHIANLFIGQFFRKPPDPAFFKQQQERFGFDAKAYFQAVAEVPIVSEEKLPAILHLISGLARQIADLSLARLRAQMAHAGVERLVAERTRELAASEARYRTLFEHLQSGFALQEIVTDAAGNPIDFRVLAANEAYLKATGFEADKLIDHCVTEFYPHVTQDSVDWIGLLGEVALRGRPLRMERYVEGLGRWFDITAYQPAPGQFAQLVDDITERKNNERALAESETMFRAMFEQAGVGVALIDSTSGAFLRVNGRYGEIVGMSPEAMIATRFMDITHPDDLSADLEQMARLRAGESRGFNMDKRYLRQDGTTVWVNLSVTPLWPPGAPPSRHVAVVQDISGRRRAEELERYAAFQAGVAEMSVSVLHNIGNAITSVANDAELVARAALDLGRVATLLRRGAERADVDPERRRAILREAASAIEKLGEETLAPRGRRIAAGIGHIADIVRLQQAAALPGTAVSTFDLGAAISDALAMQGDHFSRHGITVEVRVDPALGLVALSRNQLIQALVNVFKNAYEAILERQRVEPVAGRIEVRTEAGEAGRVRLLVEDNGVGVVAEQQPHLFRHGYSTKERGSGFGLHATALFAQDAGGAIRLSSPGRNQGAVLILELPRWPASHATPAASEDAA